MIFTQPHSTDEELRLIGEALLAIREAAYSERGFIEQQLKKHGWEKKLNPREPEHDTYKHAKHRGSIYVEKINGYGTPHWEHKHEGLRLKSSRGSDPNIANHLKSLKQS